MSKIAYLEKYVKGNISCSNGSASRPSGVVKAGLKGSKTKTARKIRDDTPCVPAGRRLHNTDTTGLFDSLVESDEDEMPTLAPGTDPSLVKEFQMGRIRCHEGSKEQHLTQRLEATQNPDMSPPRTRRRKKNASPPHQSSFVPETDSLSPSSRDLSPPRRHGRKETSAAQPSSAVDEPETAHSSGEGSQNREQIIFRDREGRQVDEEEWLKLQNKGKRSRKPPPKQVLEWGSGITQKKDKEAALQEEARLVTEPVARYDLDEEFDNELKRVERWGDPLTQAEAKAEASQQATEVSHRPKCRFAAVPNRYGIEPGYRWDGAIRGTGFEEKLLKEKNARKHLEEEEYKWSVQDW